MNWNELDWERLDRLRETFLAGNSQDAPYWLSPEDLQQYDQTYAERIGWKWDAVLDELELKAWQPPHGSVLDYGCGSGVASRRVLRRFGPSIAASLVLWDRSPLAMEFAHEQAQRQFPGLDISQATHGFITGTEPIALLVVSHVINELTADTMDELRSLIARSQSVLWTEPGTHESSRALGAVREQLRNEFSWVAPCTHALACPALAPGNERHWCHFFGHPPPGTLADSNWVKFGQRAGIDLRSLPYSFLAMDRRPATHNGLSRVIGRPEHFKPYARVLCCDQHGLEELTVPKRTAAALYKDLEKCRGPLIYRWEHPDGKVSSGERLAR